ncbi:MAG: hypothetical protein IPJ31_09625 [Bacteroidetes bacterium]|nr:hypothetical protein [Bacteroidota bacterium]
MQLNATSTYCPEIKLFKYAGGLNLDAKNEIALKSRRSFRHNGEERFYVEFSFLSELFDKDVLVRIEINDRNITLSHAEIPLLGFKSLFFTTDEKIYIIADFQITTEDHQLEKYEALFILRLENEMNLLKICPIICP